jgi:hypothetical protein
MSDPLLILNLALSQADRLMQAPDPNRIKVDDRSLAQMLSLAIDHGKLICFYDLSNAQDGDWTPFFNSDPAIAWAVRASLNPDAIEQHFSEINSRLRVDERPLLNPEAWQEMVALIKTLLGILRRKSFPDGPLNKILALVPGTDSLADAARHLRILLENTGLELRLQAKQQRFSGDVLRRLELQLGDFIGALLTAIDRNRQEAEIELYKELDCQGHAPQVAVYIAFVRLFQSAQERLNLFPGKLLDFYLQQILCQASIPSRTLRPDRLVLSFLLKPGESAALIPRSTPFAAGNDSTGIPITYSSEQELNVVVANLAAVQSMRVLALERSEGKNSAATKVPIGVLISSLKIPLPQQPLTGPRQPLFGADKPMKTALGHTQFAEIGFCVASELLHLEGGIRQVQLTLRISGSSLQKASTTLELADRSSLLESITAALQQALQFSYSTASGLEPIKQPINVSVFAAADHPAPAAVTETAAPADAEFALSFKLPASAPACQPWPAMNPKPLLLAHLKEEAMVCSSRDDSTKAQPPPALALLSLLRLSQLRLAISVDQLDRLSLHSSGGSLNPSLPFHLFGATPVRGAALRIEAAEIAAKPLDWLCLCISWYGLPISRDGFRGYYRGYVIDADGQRSEPGQLFNNEIFRVRLELERDQSADLSPSLLRSDFPLFQVGQPAAAAAAAGEQPALAPTTSLEIDLPPQNGSMSEGDAGIRPHKSTGVTGIKSLLLTLTDPPYAFGDVIYQANSLAVSMELTSRMQDNEVNQSAKDIMSASIDWPDRPWQARATEVQLAYRTCATLPLAPDADQEMLTLLHCTPLDQLQPGDWSKGDCRLLPKAIRPALVPQPIRAAKGAKARQLPESSLGVLLLDWSEPISQLSLLVGLASAASPQPLAAERSLRLDRWQEGDWLGVPPESFQDGTMGLSSSGILWLNLQPEQATSRLRVSVPLHSGPLPDLLCLEPNAVWASWQGPGGVAMLNQSRPAGTVQASPVALPAIAQIRQPLASIGGVAPASPELERVRMAERLGHKEVAIQSTDYAQLLLSAFPSLWQVAVLPARNAMGEPKPGCVTIIPIPGPDYPTITDKTTPACDPEFAKRILAELKPRISPFVELQVGTPIYCRRSVIAEVVMADATRLSIYSQQLQRDLVEFLSPWPMPDLGPRPQRYYEQTEVSQFIRDRPYVKSIDSLEILDIGDTANSSLQPADNCFIYYTSALQHQITGRGPSASLVASLDGVVGD